MDTKNDIETYSWGKHAITGDAKSIMAVKAAFAEVAQLRYLERALRQEIAGLEERASAPKPVGFPAELRHLLPGAR